jgi:hypothetical protein
MDSIAYKEGLIIEHPKLKDCGRGKILSVKGSIVEVLFSNGQTKKFDTVNIPLIVSEDQTDPCPNIRPVPKKSNSAKKTTAGPQKPLPIFEQSLDEFRNRFPNGFSDPKYIEEEREYKLEAHNLFVQALGNGQLSRLLKENCTEEVENRVLQVIHKLKVPLPNKYEEIAFESSLKTYSSEVKTFFIALSHLLNVGPDDEAINNYFIAVNELPQTGTISPNKWTVATLLPFLAQPGRFVFLKPNPTKFCADQLNHSLNYKTNLNLLTYRCLENLYDRLINQDLKILNPKDNIDIQSFIYRNWKDRQ